MKRTLILFAYILLFIGFNSPTSFAQINLPYQQKFNGPNFPPFWSQTSTISPRWSISPTSNAGGTLNEMMAVGTAGIGVSRLIVGPINTAGLTNLNLQFSQKLSCTDTANFALRIQSSLNGTNWTNEGFILDENSYNCENTINTQINNNVGATTYIAWVITGNHANLSDWYVDDIIISQVYTNDVGMTIMLFPDTLIIPNQPLEMFANQGILPVARNFGTVPQNFSIFMDISQNSISILTFQAGVSNLVPGSHVIVDFDGAFWPPPGIYTVNICTQLLGDQNSLNDCQIKDFLVGFGNIPKFPLTVSVNHGWNLVSVPGICEIGNKSVDLWWTGRDIAANVYKFEGGGYMLINNVQPGLGYWMKHQGNQIYNTGDEWPQQGIMTFFHYPIIVSKGWNLIGGYEKSISTENIFSIPPGIISSPIYEFSGGYQSADSLRPGYGYWVKTSATGQLMIDTSCTNLPPQSANKSKMVTELFKGEWGKLIITDAAGQDYTLYSVTTPEDLGMYELPPLPPAGVFDIRYSSGKIAEDLHSPQSIEMNGVVYPVKIKVENMQVKITDAYNIEIDRELIPGDELVLYNSQINKLKVQSTSPSVPVAYSLEQNYPNPFNPSTKISWQSPVSSHQVLKVFDVLGNEVAVLVNEFREAGRYEVEFDASLLASGIYLYKLKVGSFVETKKMILLR